MTDKHINKAKHTLSEEDLDALLGEVNFVEVPEMFTSKVMEGIDALPIYETDQAGTSESSSEITENGTSQGRQGGSTQQPPWWQWAALIGGGIPAFLQVLAFIFSAWNVVSLG